MDTKMRAAPWGKLDSAAGTRHHLVHHCADVAACFSQLVRSPVIGNRLEASAGRLLDDVDLSRLTALVFLHDAGKLHPGFQAKGWAPGTWHGQTVGHVQEGAEIFLASAAGRMLPIAKFLQIDSLIDWDVQPSLLRAVISHHGRPAPIKLRELVDVSRHWLPAVGYDPDAAAAQMGQAMRRWFTPAFVTGAPPLPEKAAFDHLVCGLTTLADWVGSAAYHFPHCAELKPDYFADAERAAADACRALGLDTVRQRTARLAAVTFKDISEHPAPNPQQALVGDTDLDARIVILEAETGSGKTEAALWHYARLFEAGRVDGMYFAVPTRAAAAQLHGRVVDAAKRLYGSASPEPVLAVPGYVRAGAAEGTRLPHWRVLWDDAATAERGSIDGRWAAEQSNRFLAAQIAVGTVDQAMLGALKVKHAHLRASSLSRNLLVIDEVHASDSYMTQVQKRLLNSHVGIGGYAMLMSATLGSFARCQWLIGTASPSFVDAVDIPYPAVWTSKSPLPRAPTTASNRKKAVHMAVLNSMAPITVAAQALAAARSGARVLVIRNTVTHAIDTLVALEALADPEDAGLLFIAGGKSTLHHSRFAPSDRSVLDAAVETALSPKSGRPIGGRVVIGTQTLEQSLDIDADLLLTDLCPVDVLLQRIGRLHRHRLPRPEGFHNPQCIVMVPEDGLERLLAPAFENGLGAWRTSAGLQGVYRDLSIIELTRRLVVDHPTWTIPDMNRALVEGATHPERIEALHEELGPKWSRYHTDIVGRELGDKMQAAAVLIDRGQSFDELSFPRDGEERIRTRLGEEGPRLEFAQPLPMGPFKEPVSEVVVPAHWARGLVVDETPIQHTTVDDTVLISVGEVKMTYDRFGLKFTRGRSVEPAHRSIDPPGNT